MIITWIAKTLVAINSNTKPLHIGMAMALAFLAGMIPMSLVLIFCIILAFLIKINQSVFLVFMAIFSLLSGLLTPLTSRIGYFILSQPFLFGFFTAVKNAPVLAFSDFDFTAVTGGLVFGILAFIPVCLLTVLLVKIYRKNIRDRIAGSKLVKSFQKFPLVSKLGKASKKLYSIYQIAR